ncbi:MAG TPA: hypothetical protein VE999_12630 [Gemmataceae bacterium]|nr:hypothetical protein [Gemmataceae bacterium]
MNAHPVSRVPPPLSQPVPCQPRARIPWKILVGTTALAALLILAEYRWLRGRQQAQSIAWANQQVQDKIAAARVHLAEQKWDKAIRQLEDALDVEEATIRDTVIPVLEEARRGQAEGLWDAAGIALAHRRIGDALRLLRVYLAHPHAGHLDRARSLRDEIERALSDDEAARFLARLSDETLAVFAEKGQLTVDDGMLTAATRALFQESLRRNVPAEWRKREAQREVARLTAERRAAQRARRIAHLRATPAFHSLTAFLDQMHQQLRDQQQLASRQDAEFTALFRQLGVTDPAEKEQIRSDLLDHQSPAAIQEQIERKRSEVKHAYRKEPEFNPSDGELFDQLVDQEVDKTLKMLRAAG